MDEKLTTSVIVSDLNYIKVSDYRKKGTKAWVNYVCTGTDEYLELPILNYAGYRAYDENGKRIEITEGNYQRMRIMLPSDGQEHSIYIRFGPVAGFVIANVISALTIAGIIVIWLKRRQFLPSRSRQ